eukprot:scaffold673058_cov61-Prasinocladus_malaysianus.AAC.1
MAINISFPDGGLGLDMICMHVVGYRYFAPRFFLSSVVLLIMPSHAVPGSRQYSACFSYVNAVCSVLRGIAAKPNTSNNKKCRLNCLSLWAPRRQLPVFIGGAAYE